MQQSAATGFVARQRGLFQQQDLPAILRQRQRRRTSGRARADHRHVVAFYTRQCHSSGKYHWGNSNCKLQLDRASR